MKSPWAVVASLLLVAACAEPSPTDPPAPLVPDKIEYITASGLTGGAGSWLSEPVGVLVTHAGVPLPGIVVRWSPSYRGAVEQDSSITGEDGVATVRWQLSQFLGPQTLFASVDGINHKINFGVNAVVGPPATLVMASGNSQWRYTWDRDTLTPLSVYARDAGGNRIDAGLHDVTWTVLSGPVELFQLARQPAVDTRSIGIRHLRVSGTAIVRAKMSSGAEARFTINIVTPLPAPNPSAGLVPGPDEHLMFRSFRNFTSGPAVDTVHAGEDFTLSHDAYWDTRTYRIMGLPGFPAGANLYYCDFLVIRFDVPGTYHYFDADHPINRGILVVLSK